MGSLVSGEAGHRVGTHARQEGWEYRIRMGRLHPVTENQGVYRTTKRRATFVIERKTKHNEQTRARGRASRRSAEKTPHEARNRNKALVSVATYNVRTLAI